MTNKDLIRQYVDTGIPIPESQLLKLSSNNKNTYIRKRIIASEHGSEIEDYEFLQMNPEQRKYFVSKLDSFRIDYLLTNSSQPDKVIDILLSTEGFISKLDTDGIYILFQFSSQRDKVIDILLSTEGFISKFDTDDIYILLYFSFQRDKVIDILLSTEEFISKLDSNGIGYLLFYSSQPDKVKQDLINAGISKDVINSIITNHKIKTELIPESDESKLRKKIIQLLR